MKKTVIGSVFMICGALMDMGILISSAVMGASLTEWVTDKGKLWTALEEQHLTTLFGIMSLLFVAGILILFVEYFRKESV